ncbi:MAG: hypothetical protein JSW17_05200, partial [Candidatus Omnitrophota bacterium]
RYNHSELDGIFPNRHYLIIDNLSRNLDTTMLQSIAGEAYSWYKAHDCERTAKAFALQLMEKDPH